MTTTPGLAPAGGSAGGAEVSSPSPPSGLRPKASGDGVNRARRAQVGKGSPGTATGSPSQVGGTGGHGHPTHGAGQSGLVSGAHASPPTGPGAGGPRTRPGASRPIVPAKKMVIPKAWKTKIPALRSHSDAVRTVVLHPSRLLLASGSDDCCVKLWVLPSVAADKPGAVKKAPVAVAEPMRTLRGHVTPVLSCAMVAGVSCTPAKSRRRSGSSASAGKPSGAGIAGDGGPVVVDVLASGSLDGRLLLWDVPSDSAPSSSYAVGAGDTFPLCSLDGHTDAVWSVAFAPRGYALSDVVPSAESAASSLDPDLPILISASADRTVRVWCFNPLDPVSTVSHSFDIPEMLRLSHNPAAASYAGAAVPTVVAVNPIALSLEFFVGTTNGLIIKIGGGGLLLTLHSPDDASVTSMCTHPTLPLLFAGHANGFVRAYDISSGRQLYAVRGHGSEVMSMAVDPTGMVLATAGNDCVTKWWSVESRTQLDHQTKNVDKAGEGVLCVAFHPSKPLMVSGGADATINVFS